MVGRSGHRPFPRRGHLLSADLSTPPPTRLRRRITGTVTDTPRAWAPLPEAARRALAAISGGRPREELVVLAAAAAWTTSAAEHTGELTFGVSGPDGLVTVTTALDSTTSPGRLIAALDAALRVAGSESNEVDHRHTLVVASARFDGPAVPVPTKARTQRAGLRLTLGAPEGSTRDLIAEADSELAEPWYLDVFLRAVATTLAVFGEPRTPLAEVPTGAEEDLVASAGYSRSGIKPEREPCTLTAPIASATARHPGRTAVVAADETLTYDQLWRSAGAVAVRLRELGVGSGDRVGVLTGKSVYALPAILGVLRARAAYVPIDDHIPPARAAAILDDAGARMVLSAGPPAVDFEVAWPGKPIIDLVAEELLNTNRFAAVGASDPAVALPVPEPDDLAYVIYTSGSTGAPKGVAVRHRAVSGYVRWKIAHNGLDDDSRVLQIPSHAFDSSISDLFPTLAAGGLLVLVDPARSTPTELAAVIAEHQVTQFITVPTLYRLLLEDLVPMAGSLRLVTVAGEAMPADLVARHRTVLPKVRLLNEYGPTENSVGATVFDYDGDSGCGSPIGVPLSNTVVRVTDSDGRDLPPGFVGELRLSGHSLADGYLGRPDLTAAAFTVEHSVPGAREYRTGDLGWWRPDGVLEFAGRTDHQVKIRGQRVEPEEVETVLACLPGVRAAVVVATVNPDGATALTAFVEVPTDVTDIEDADGETVAKLRSAAAPRLSSAMMPGRIVLLLELPRMVSGKPDRQALAAAVAHLGEGTGSSYFTPAAFDAASAERLDPIEAVVTELFREVLGGVPVGPDDDFFLLGGHSLLAISLLSAIETRLGSMLDLNEFFSNATVRSVAVQVRACGSVQSTAARPDRGIQSGSSGSADALSRLLDEL